MRSGQVSEGDINLVLVVNTVWDTLGYTRPERGGDARVENGKWENKSSKVDVT